MLCRICNTREISESENRNVAGYLSCEECEIDSKKNDMNINSEERKVTLKLEV